MAEQNTDNLVLALLTGGGKGYPVVPDTRNSDGVVWYQQNSYTAGECENSTLTRLFEKAAKSQKGTSGRAEFVIDTPNFYIVIEDKDDTKGTMFSGYPELSDYLDKGYDKSRLYKCPIDDVLWYAEHLKSEKDVIAIANYSNGSLESFQSATFFYPKNGKIQDIGIVCSGGYTTALLSLSEYEQKIAVLKGETERTYEEIYDDLRKYAETSSRFLYKVLVDEADRLGLVSIVALALTNKKSVLYNKVSTGTQIITKEDVEKALLEDSDTSMYGIITDPKKGLPAEKIATLREYVQSILIKSHLTKQLDGTIGEWDAKDKSSEQFFAEGGNTILSRITYSLYNNIITKYERYKDKGIDIMGTFYSLFLVYYASDKKKGVVLTPAHITRLFCDLAEYFMGKKLDKDTTVLDICTGSGGFLIAALNYIDKSIDSDDTLTDKQKKHEKEVARKRCLIGAELAPNMFMLAYANMNFHGDGSSRLYNLDSLLSDVVDDEQTFGAELCEVYDPNGSLRHSLYEQYSLSIEQHKNESNDDYEKRLRNLIVSKVFEQNGADVGMINPPYGKDYEEYDFIDAELKYLKKGGIGLAIVPVSNQGASKDERKQAVLEKHTLLASILMPNQLFANICNSGASVGTCILVFRAHMPHQDFLKSGGKTFLADWREDGFKMVSKHGRFEFKNSWYAPITGYHDKYIADMDKTVMNDFEKLMTLNNAYRQAFPDENAMPATMIPSSSFRNDILDGGIKSIAVKIFDNPHTEDVVKHWSKDGTDKTGTSYEKGEIKYQIEKVDGPQATDAQGNPVFFKNGKPKLTKVFRYKRDANGNKIPMTEPEIVYDNMDWNILDYVKTDYHELTNADFIKTMRNYKLFQFMLACDLISGESIGIQEVLDAVFSDDFKTWFENNANMDMDVNHQISLVDKKWEEFLLDDLFDIEPGIYYSTEEYDEGTTPYISASNQNNGVSKFISLPPDFDGNCIITGKVGCTAFYQEKPFCATSDVNVFHPLFDMTTNIGLFIATQINHSANYKYDYVRQCRVGDSKRLRIFLPVDSNSDPDWNWIEQYMKSLPYSDK